MLCAGTTTHVDGASEGHLVIFHTILTHLEDIITEDADEVARGKHTIGLVSDADEAMMRIDEDASAVQFVVCVHLSKLFTMLATKVIVTRFHI